MGFIGNPRGLNYFPTQNKISVTLRLPQPPLNAHIFLSFITPTDLPIYSVDTFFAFSLKLNDVIWWSQMDLNEDNNAAPFPV